MADEGAEAYWYEAINDPSLSAHERQDLIEDLNEEGIHSALHLFRQRTSGARLIDSASSPSFRTSPLKMTA